MISSIASFIRDASNKKIGTLGIDLNMDGLQILKSSGINLPDHFFYFVITGKKEVVWHS